MFYIDLYAKHTLAAANAHYYKQPTGERYIDRVLKYHDLIYLVDGGWSFIESEKEYSLHKDDVLLLASGRHHFNKLPCLPGTRTFCLHISCEPSDTAENPSSTEFTFSTRRKSKNTSMKSFQLTGVITHTKSKSFNL